MINATDISSIAADLILSGGSSRIYRPWESEDMERFDAAYGAGSIPADLPDGGFIMFASEWMEMSPWRPGHRAQFAPTAFDASLAAIASKEHAAFIYGDGEHKGYAFTALANTLNEWGDPGSAKFWAGSEGLWAAFVPSDAPFLRDSVVANMRNGTVRQVSISCVPMLGDYEWNPDTKTKDWTVTEARLREGSPVTEPKHSRTKIFLNRSPEEEEPHMPESKPQAEAPPQETSEHSAADKPYRFDASELAAAVGEGVAAALRSLDRTPPADAQTIPDTGPTAQPAQASAVPEEGSSNVINLSSLKARLSAIGD